MSTGAPVIPVTIASPASSVGRVEPRPAQGESRAQSQRVEAPVFDTAAAQAPVEEQGQAQAESSSRMQEAITRYLKTSQNILRFERDEGTQRVIVKVVDPETKQTLRQYPPEEIIRMAESLDEVRGALVDKRI